VYSLQRLIDCANANLGRMRVVWARVWAAVASHLVSAACNSDAEVASLAVDSLRQLAAKLLAKAEVQHFAQQVPRATDRQTCAVFTKSLNRNHFALGFGLGFRVRVTNPIPNP
jgi:hypothetical protein